MRVSRSLDDLLQQLSTHGGLLSVRTTAETLGVTPAWVRQLIHDGEIRGINVGGHDNGTRWRVDPEDLRAFMHRRANRVRGMIG